MTSFPGQDSNLDPRFQRALGCHYPTRDCFSIPLLDSNPDRLNQNQPCCRYTKGESTGGTLSTVQPWQPVQAASGLSREGTALEPNAGTEPAASSLPRMRSAN